MTVALESTFRGLYDHFKRLQDNLKALYLTVAEDKPLSGEAALVDRMEDTIMETMGLLDGCLSCSHSAQKCVDQPDLDRARRALNKCQEHFHCAERQFSNELVPYEKLRDLANIGGRRGKEWASWAGSVKYGLEQCKGPFDESSKALAACWQELAEHSGTTSIVINSRIVGQKLSVNGLANADVASTTAS
jgi:hypothetical protein